MLKIFAESLPAPISRRHADFYGRQSTDFKTARRFLRPAKHRFQDGTPISTAGKAPISRRHGDFYGRQSTEFVRNPNALLFIKKTFIFPSARSHTHRQAVFEWF
jgi:hypothetical protein